jgi:hypothetical protein
MTFSNVRIYFLFTLLFVNHLFAQGDFPDKTEQRIIQREDTLKEQTETKSPVGAMLRSLLLPGLGQVYVHQYWKAPLFFGGAAVMYYYVFKHNSDFLDYSRQYDEIAKVNPQDPQLYFLKVKRENSRDNRDISIFFLAGVYALSMLDAYVDAHLFNFNVNENVKLSFYADSRGIKFSVSIFK